MLWNFSFLRLAYLVLCSFRFGWRVFVLVDPWVLFRLQMDVPAVGGAKSADGYTDVNAHIGTNAESGYMDVNAGPSVSVEDGNLYDTAMGGNSASLYDTATQGDDSDEEV
jgi:hypothetical protein